ncbi:ATP-binding protein [Pontiella sp.]|uniref:ATP-binding protein n=1 Tax=Pontiella sp. TaxID=2837462 RepID=UPI0035669587
MKRKIIEINEDLCNGCGECIVGCAEGALQLVNGKAKMVKEDFCDGFGDCIGTCPTGALKIVEREAAAYDIEATREHVAKMGDDALKKFDEANAEHDAKEKAAAAKPAGGGCPGLQLRFGNKAKDEKPKAASSEVSGQVIKSDLDQWPIQLHLVPPTAPFFEGKELVVLSTCSPVASPDVHWRYVRGRALVVACPKLDKTEGYVEKLAGIMAGNNIPKVIIVRMSVPCCGGLTAITKQAHAMSGRTDLIVEEVTIGLDGELLGTKQL